VLVSAFWRVSPIVGPATSLGGGVETCTATLSAAVVRGLFRPRSSGPMLVIYLDSSTARPEFDFDAGGPDFVFGVWLC
jgi:hypothetical protein